MSHTNADPTDLADNTDLADKAARLRRQLAAKLQAIGDLRSPEWRAAVEAVPRHELLRGGFFVEVPGSVPTAWRPVLPETDPDGWLTRCYADESLVTQIAGTLMPEDLSGTVTRAPSSSSTMPSLVVSMLEDLDVQPGMRVLEIGTGSGYDAALLCHRLGEDLVTSIEIDPDVAARARAALWRAGYAPEVVVGDGLAGHPDGAPYDRLVVTCGVRSVPGAWLKQVRPGGLILTTLRGWLYASGLVRLTVAEDGTAAGRFLSDVSFMHARSHQPPGGMQIPASDQGTERRSRIGREVLDDWTGRFVVQCAAPWVQHARMSLDGASMADYLVDARTDAFVVVREQPDDAVTVRQGGPARLWDDIEVAILAWQAAGRPTVEQFRMRVGSAEQTIWLDTESGRLSFALG